jgi:putative glycosyl hydrolase
MISHKTLLYANTLLFVGLAGGLKAAPIGFTPTEQTAQLNATSGDMAFVIKKARKVNAHTVELTDAQNRKITVDFYGNNIFRIYQDPAGSAPHNPEAKPAADILVEQPRKQVARLELQQNDQNCTLTTDEIKVVFDNKNSGFAVYKKNEIDPVISSPSFRTFDNDGTHLELTCSPGEYFYGGGVQNGRFSHRGQRIAIENTNNWVDGGVASPTPFYWSTKGYGMLWHTFKPGLYDFGATDAKKVKLRHGEKYLDVFFWVGDRPEALLDGFYQLTGNPVLLPKFGFYEGHLNAYNRDYWTEAKDGKGFMKMEDGKTYNESQKNNGGIRESLNGELENYQFSARAAIDRYLNNDMPLGWFLPNDGYGAGYGQTTTLDGNIKNLKSFGDYARSKGVEIGLWTQSDLHPKDSIEALLQRDIVKEVRDAGVRVLKTDVAWVGWGYSFGLNGVADVGKIMPKYGNNARPFIISLDGWAGTQRYAGIWSGDQTGGDWEYIRFHIPTFIGSGLSGQPNITSDLDGIFGGKNIPVNVREFQWKTFTPMELNMDGWGANPKYPQALGGKSTALNRWYLKLKSELLPYTYTAAAQAINGRPIIRPMFMEERNDYTLGKRTQYQYMYGDAFLVAPVYQNTAADAEGNDRRDGIYLPQGTWVDYFTGDRYEGGRILNDFDAPLWKLPVLVKADAIIPMANPNNNPSQIRKDLRIYEIYAQHGTKALEYDDDGRTQAYLTGENTNTQLSTSVNKKTLTFKAERTAGDFDGYIRNKATELRINVTRTPKAVMAQVGANKAVKLTEVKTREAFEKGDNVWFYDARPNLNRWVRPGEESVGEVIKNPQVLVRVAPTDVSENTVSVEVKGFEFAPADRLLTHRGKLKTTQLDEKKSKVEAYAPPPPPGGAAGGKCRLLRS